MYVDFLYCYMLSVDPMKSSWGLLHQLMGIQIKSINKESRLHHWLMSKFCGGNIIKKGDQEDKECVVKGWQPFDLFPQWSDSLIRAVDYIWCGDLFCWHCCDYCVLSVSMWCIPIICCCSVCCTVPCLDVFTVLLMYVVVRCCW